MSKPKGIVDWLAEDSPMAKAREAERAATEAEIVAYMRDPARRREFVMMGPRAIAAIADAIERGEYRK